MVLLLDALYGHQLPKHFGGVGNGHAYQDLQLAREEKRHCGIAVPPEGTIPDWAKLCHNSPVYLQGD